MKQHYYLINRSSLNKISISLLLMAVALVTQAKETQFATDSVAYYLQQQLIDYPQEKIYLQTDKAAYLSGERIWFRAHMVDALTHQPAIRSRYIYVEMISPLDNLVKRVKIRHDSTGVYAGYIDLDEDLPQGGYTLRAYT